MNANREVAFTWKDRHTRNQREKDGGPMTGDSRVDGLVPVNNARERVSQSNAKHVRHERVEGLCTIVWRTIHERTDRDPCRYQGASIRGGHDPTDRGIGRNVPGSSGKRRHLAVNENRLVPLEGGRWRKIVRVFFGLGTAIVVVVTVITMVMAMAMPRRVPGHVYMRAT